MRFRWLPCSLVVLLLLDAAPAAAQFNPQGRGRKPKAGAPAPAKPAGGAKPKPRSAAPTEKSEPSVAPSEAAPPKKPEAQSPSQDALIARYTAIALAQPGADFPLQRLSELYRARDGKLDALIADMSRRAEQRGPERLAALLALAGAYQHDGKSAEAAQTYERALAEAPNSPVAELGLARLYAEKGERAKARVHYEKALPLINEATQREQVLRSLITLALDSGSVPDAKKYHEELVRRQGGSFFTRAELGRELYARGMYPEAVQELSQVVKAGAGDNRVLAPALRDYGRALAKAGRRQEAKKELERALAVAGAQAGVRREIYETIVELYRADDRISDLVQELERRGARDPEEQRMLGSLFEETGKLDKALATYRKVLEREPKDIGTRLKVVHILEVQGELEQAIREYEALAQAAPRNPDYVFRLADALIQRGDRKRALDQLRALENRSGDDDEILSALVGFYERIGEKNASLGLLQRLSARAAGDPQHLVELGSRYWQEGDKKKAVGIWQRIRVVAKDRAQGLLTLGELYLEHDLVKEALEALDEAVRLDPKQVRLRKAQAIALERAGTSAGSRDARLAYHERALKLWEQILKESAQNPQLAREARQHVVTLWSLSGTLVPRAAGLERRLAAKPPDLDAGRLLAEAEMRQRRYSEAERTLRRIVAAAPSDVESLAWLERVLGLQHKLAEAIEVLERLSRVEPKRAREYYRRMAEYAAELYRDDDAIRYASRAVELAPDDAEGHKDLGQMYRKRGDTARAVAELRQAIAKNDRLFPVYFELAELLLGQGQAEEADLLLRRVVRAAPDEELIVRAMRLSLQVNLGRGSVDVLERDLLPLALDNPDRPIYRRLLVELYGTLAYPLLNRAHNAEPSDAEAAEQQLRKLGERAVKPLLDALSDARDTQQEIATTLLMYVANKSAAPALLAYAVGSASPRLRARAMLAVGALQDPSLVPRIAEIVAPGGRARSEESDPVLLAAAWGLCRSGAPSARPGLVALSTSSAPGLRAFGVLGLGVLGDKRNAPLVVRALAATDAGPLPRAAAAFSAGQLGLSQQASELAELVHSPDALLSANALVALARLGAPKSADLVAQKLFTQDPESRPAARAAALVLATGHYRRKTPLLPIPSSDLELANVLAGLVPDGFDAAAERAALARLAPALEAAAKAAVRSSPDTARAVAEALSSDAGVSFSNLLVLSAKDPATQKEAARIADRVAEHTVPDFAALSSHPEASVRSFALGFLARRPEAEATAALARAVDDSDPAVQRAVLAAIGPHHVAAAPALVRLARDGDWGVRAAAVSALGRLIVRGAPPSAIAALQRAASADETALVREAALAAFARAAPDLARPELERARDSDPEPHVRKAAAALLRDAAGSKR
ncbi:MAG: tetratricopeptide repeat protein [Myxococcota bacterium]